MNKRILKTIYWSSATLLLMSTEMATQKVNAEVNQANSSDSVEFQNEVSDNAKNVNSNTSVNSSTSENTDTTTNVNANTDTSQTSSPQQTSDLNTDNSQMSSSQTITDQTAQEDGFEIKQVDIYHVHRFQKVYDNYNNPEYTGQILASNSNWIVLKKAHDQYGNKWYKLGRNQWVLANGENAKNLINNQVDSIKQPELTTKALIVIDNSNRPRNLTIQSSAFQANKYIIKPRKYTYPAVMFKTVKTYQKPVYKTTLSKKEQQAKRYIAIRESGNDYLANVTVGSQEFYGKYLLDKSLLKGDLSPMNQEKTADKYVKRHYGNWQNALKFYKKNHCF